MYRNVTLLVAVALAIMLAAATVAAGAPPEKRTVCQDGVTKEIPAHAKAKGATEGPCAEEPPGEPVAVDLIGLVAEWSDQNNDGMINTLLWPQLVGAECSVVSSGGSILIEALSGQRFLIQQGPNTTFAHDPATGLYAEGVNGNLVVLSDAGQIVTLDRGEYRIVQANGIECTR